MSSGKIAAHHATLACYKTMLDSNPTFLRQWEQAGQTKIALRCSSEEELLSLQTQARRLNLCAQSIRDAGRTQIAAGSRTVLGILGPARVVNQVTGALRVL
ncbi:peptidyl-tRNA hydrolase [Cyathus striatus]|nr:peptidyl-tRNA hydrolase [Cyathus striatus]KAF9014962.1 peptidyl-tRNA hydrolase [Cyathus striatus]